jgi:hypothetical protein
VRREHCLNWRVIPAVTSAIFWWEGEERGTHQFPLQNCSGGSWKGSVGMEGEEERAINQ